MRSAIPAVFGVLERSRFKRVVRMARRRLRLPGIEIVKPRVLRVLPHDPLAHTQGLACVGASIFESTGQVGSSTIRRLNAVTGAIEQCREVPSVWAEGIAVHGNRLVQLTYKDGVAFVYDMLTLVRVGSFRYSGQGWGLAAMGDGFVMSDGSGTLTYRDDAFEPVGTLAVHLAEGPLTGINDLEFARGRIYANVVMHHDIYEVDPASGDVTRVVDCTDLLRLSGRARRSDVLNGLAYCNSNDTFFVAGKHWPRIFEVTITP